MSAWWVETGPTRKLASPAAQADYVKALSMAVRLNERELLAAVCKGIPIASVELVGRELPRTYLERVLHVVAAQLQHEAHLEYHVRWVTALLGPHATYVRMHRSAFAPTLRALHKALQEQRDGLLRLADSNRFALAYLAAAQPAAAEGTNAVTAAIAVVSEAAEAALEAVDGGDAATDGGMPGITDAAQAPRRANLKRAAATPAAAPDAVPEGSVRTKSKKTVRAGSA